MRTAARCMPVMPNWIGRTRRTPSCGTQSPCCGSTGWSQQQWDDAVDSLRTRDLLDDAGQLTAAGNDLRTSIEDLTDELAYAPWQTVSDDDVQELVALGEIIRDGVRAACVFPTNAFGPRYGQHR